MSGSSSVSRRTEQRDDDDDADDDFIDQSPAIISDRECMISDVVSPILTGSERTRDGTGRGAGTDGRMDGRTDEVFGGNVMPFIKPPPPPR